MLPLHQAGIHAQSLSPHEKGPASFSVKYHVDQIQLHYKVKDTFTYCVTVPHSHCVIALSSGGIASLPNVRRPHIITLCITIQYTFMGCVSHALSSTPSSHKRLSCTCNSAHKWHVGPDTGYAVLQRILSDASTQVHTYTVTLLFKTIPRNTTNC